LNDVKYVMIRGADDMEQVLVVRREVLEAKLGDVVFSRVNIDSIVDFIRREHFFVPRASAEYDNTVKQIIPYVVIRQAERYFVMKRLARQTEARLHNLLSLGVGGHINPEENREQGESVLEAGLYRELHEEVYVEEILSLNCVGVLNENTGGVGDYHTGIVYLLEARGEVRVVETEKMEGSFMTCSQMEEEVNGMETWSQLIFRELILPSGSGL
jgi:predicted NUDIX family phosphoesterase